MCSLYVFLTAHLLSKSIIYVPSVWFGASVTTFTTKWHQLISWERIILQNTGVNYFILAQTYKPWIGNSPISVKR